MAGAFLWLVHPLQSQSVTYIIQRMNSLAALFSILSLWLYVRGRSESRRQWSWFAGALVAFLLALGSKESAVILPLIVILYEWFFIRDLTRQYLKTFIFPALAAIALLVCLGYCYLGAEPFSMLEQRYAIRDFTMSERLLIESSMIGLEILFEHRLYLASMFVCLSVAAYGDRLLRSQQLKIVLLSVVLILFTFWTIERNSQWQDPVAFWTDASIKAPKSARAANNLAASRKTRPAGGGNPRSAQGAQPQTGLCPRPHG